MPPRRKSRANIAEVLTPAEEEAVTPVESSKPPDSPPPASDRLQDPWSAEQETTLFKGIIRWKPSGMHKHFRMIALAEHLRHHGWDATTYAHTRIPAIWAKLGKLYNLDAIDEIDNATDDEDLPDDPWREFTLPDAEYGELMWHKGVDSNAHSSPAQLNRSPSPPPPRKRKRGEPKTRASTIDDTDEAQTSPVASPIVRAPRGRGRRKASLKTEESKETPDADSDEEMADVDDADSDSDSDDDDDDDEGTPSVRMSKGPGRPARGRPAGKTQGSARKSSRRRR